MDFINAVFLGIVEGLTEFLPISSTGHLILSVDILGMRVPPGQVFEIVIQLGAILAILVLYWRKFFDVLTHLHTPRAQHFVRNILLAVTPAMGIGFFAHDIIKTALFNPTVVAWALIVGGIAILVIERVKPEATIHETEDMTAKTALAIGFIQCVAMIPGVSRSGATIMGALMMKVGRKTAAEFSFFLAIPTMLAATSYDLYKTGGALAQDDKAMIAVGFVTAFVVALLVVRWLVRFVQTHGFGVFAWYRIALGVVILALA